mmetsp:Transcript_24411/g.36223  ORF Transcript_24411/g.36223 Transcript_24411/m.36223 type:complete len:303 (-) Transcript_24411:227-1135(-)
MSFRDVYRHTSIERQFHEREESRDEKEEPFPDEQPSPDFCVDQINNALHDHKRERNFLKEKGLMEQANTMERYNTPRKRRTAFSNLNDEIVQFQKIVNDLHRATENDVKTPEEQWRLRILVKSAQDADAAISQRVEHCTWQKCDVAVRASFSKLKRDYERAHETYEKVTEIYLLKQSAEVSMLSSKQEETIHDTYSQRNHILVSQEEDFYDRTMREREQEAKKINDKLHVVNGIYEDLGRIVSEQQEKIDMVEDNLLHSSGCAQGGLEQLKKKKQKEPKTGLCSSIDRGANIVDFSLCHFNR